MSPSTSCLGLLKMLLVLSKKKCAFNFSSYKNSKCLTFWCSKPFEILLMDKLLHHQGWWLTIPLFPEVFLHPRWLFGISSINRMSMLKSLQASHSWNLQQLRCPSFALLRGDFVHLMMQKGGQKGDGFVSETDAGAGFESTSRKWGPSQYLLD